MWRTLIRGGIVGGVIVFIWLTISWMILPFHNSTIQSFRDDGDVIEHISDEAPRDGVYMVPSAANKKAAQNKPQTFMLVTIKRGPHITNMTGPIICSLITQIVGAMLISYLLLQTKMLRYWHRVSFVTIAGLTAGLLGYLPDWTWFGFTGGYVFAQILDFVIGWFLAGLAIGKLVRR